MPLWAKILLGIVGGYIVLNIIVNIGAACGLDKVGRRSRRAA